MAQIVPTKFLCMSYGHVTYTSLKSPVTYCRVAWTRVTTASSRIEPMRSVSPSRPAPARPTVHPTTSAPEMRNQAWTHSTAFAMYALFTTVKRVANW